MCGSRMTGEDWNGITGGGTIEMKRDTVFPSRYWRNICSCLIYLRATPASVELMQFWADIMSLKDWKPPIQDQPFFNKALNNLTETKVSRQNVILCATFWGFLGCISAFLGVCLLLL